MKNGKWDSLNWTNLSRQEQDTLQAIRQKKYWDDTSEQVAQMNTNARLMESGKGTLWRDLPLYLQPVVEKLLSAKREMYLTRYGQKGMFTHLIATYLAYYETLLDLKLPTRVVPPSSSYLEAIYPHVPLELLLILRDRMQEHSMINMYADNGLEYEHRYRRTGLFELVDMQTGEIICG